MDPRAVAADIAAELAMLADPARAVSERAYLKSDLVHLGTGVPAVRTVVRSRLRRWRPDHDELRSLCDALWDEPVHEHRLAAVEALAAAGGALPAAALPTVADLPWIEQLVRESRTWALVDPLAGSVVSALAVRDAAALDVLDRWVTSDDFWVRRSAVLALRGSLAAGTEWDRFVRYADLLLDEREFFIRKVIGWVAREEGRRQPAVVSAWARRRLGRMSGVTVREVVKPLPDGPELLAAWRDQPVRRKRSG